MSPKYRNKFFAALALVVIASLAIGSIPVQAGGPPSLFGDAGDLRPADARPDEFFVMRSRYVLVNTGMLFDANGRPQSKLALPEIAFDLFPDARFVGVVTRVQNNGLGYSWTGRLRGQQLGYFYLTMTEGIFMAHIASTKGVYEVSWAGEGFYKVTQIDQSKLKDHEDGAPYDPPGPILPPADLGPGADSGAIIDVMVVYSDDARSAAGGTAQIKAAIATAMTETNTSYNNSGVTPDLRLVHVEEVSYAESGSTVTDVDRLAGTSDGYMDGIHSLRNTYGADVVVLVVETLSACGRAKAIMASATTAFAVTKRTGCMTGYYSFGHEIGHLQGAHHDLYVDTNDTPYAYGHGYVHKHATDTTKRWRTVMAYNDACSASGYNCNRLQWWSNPTKTKLGDAMGVVGDSENYKALNTSASTVANFRTAIISTDQFNSSFNGSSTGWSSVYGAWSINSSAYYYAAGVAGYSSSAKHTGTYGDITYEVRMYRTGTNNGSANRIIIRGNPAGLNSTKSWKSSYEFAYSNTGSYSIWKIDSAGNVIKIKDWTATSAITKNGWNTLKVVAVGSSIRFFINGVGFSTITDTSFKTGAVGFGFYRDSGSTGNALYVDWAKLTNTPTADGAFSQANEMLAEGMEVPGGDHNQAP